MHTYRVFTHVVAYMLSSVTNLYIILSIQYTYTYT